MNHSILPDILNHFLDKVLNKRNRITFLLLFLAGLIIGLVKVWLADEHYGSSIIVASPYIESKIVIDLLNEIKPFIQEEEMDFVAHKLGVTRETASILEDLDAVKIEERIGKKVKESNRFSIHTQTNSDQIALIDSVFKGLLRFVHSNAYVENQIALEKARITNYKAEVKRKIEELEDFQSGAFERVALTQELVSYHNQIVELHKKRVDLEDELQKVVALQTINNDPYPMETKKRYINELVLFSLIPVAIWIIYLLVLVFVQTPDRSPSVLKTT